MQHESLIKILLEIAEELDKGDNADIHWLKYMGESVREAARLIQLDNVGSL